MKLSNKNKTKTHKGVSKIAQWLKSVAAKPESLRSATQPHMAEVESQLLHLLLSAHLHIHIMTSAQLPK